MSNARICDGCGKTIADGKPYTIVRLDVTRILQGAPNRAAVQADICGDLECAAAWFVSKRVTGELFRSRSTVVGGFVERHATGEAPKAAREKKR